MEHFSGNAMGLETILNFLNELEKHQQSSNQFFVTGLLELVRKYSGYDNIYLTKYDGNRVLTDALSIDKADLFHQYYKHSFYKHDVLAEYLFRLPQELLQSGRSVFKGTELTEIQDFIRTDYVDFMGRGGFSYVAVMDFKFYRLNFFKGHGQTDFSTGEVNFLSLIQNIIAGRFRNFQAEANIKLVDQIRRTFLSDEGIGFIIFDDSKAVLDYNQKGLQYVMELCPAPQISETLDSLVKIINDNAEQGSPLHCRYKDYSLSMNTIHTLGEDVVKRYFYLAITRQPHAIMEAKELTQRFTELSKRELEVLDAFCRGDDYNEIATRLFITEHTVRAHLKRIYRKLDVPNQRALVFLYSQYRSGMKK